MTGCPGVAHEVAAAAAAETAADDEGVWAAADRRRPGVAGAVVQHAEGTETMAVQVAEYTLRTENLRRRRTARTRDP